MRLRPGGATSRKGETPPGSAPPGSKTQSGLGQQLPSGVLGKERSPSEGAAGSGHDVVHVALD